MSSGIGRRDFLRSVAGGTAALSLTAWPAWLLGQETQPGEARPNVILCMTDDQGWGDTSYNGHPELKTPAMDAMAAAGIRFNRFYAAAPVCSPTRGSVMTGRHPNRFGCFTWGKPLRPQEVTVAQMLKAAGYATGHFGKWHLSGVGGSNKPELAEAPLNPGRFGFDEWVSGVNYFDLNPTLGRQGVPEKFTGDGSDVIVEEALKFIRKSSEKKQPFLAVIWYGSPHNPHQALAKDKEPYAGLGAKWQNYYGEIAAVDRSLGHLRAELRNLGIADNTIVWYCSDNGGNEGPKSTGGLRGGKGTLWEGGVRVPGILEWPDKIRKPFASDLPASTMDILPTLTELLGVQVAQPVKPIDGVSLAPLVLSGKMDGRPKPMPFWVYEGKGDGGHAALIDGDYKLHLRPRLAKDDKKADTAVLLYDLTKDPKETKDLAGELPEVTARMKATLEQWEASVRDSLAGKDYR